MVEWANVERAIAVAKVEPLLPNAPGKYAFFVDSLENLPCSFQIEARRRLIPRLIYIGKADVSLWQRVWQEECHHRRPGTFFRSVGAMLGYVSPKGGKNYEFAPDDKQRIIEWIGRHLLVAWHSEKLDQSHAVSERELIIRFMPLLNLQGNPLKLLELQRLRAICRNGEP